MTVPAASTAWPRCWFSCPHCSYRGYSAHALIRPEGFRYDNSVVFYSFWCKQCRCYSALAHPVRLGLGVVVALLASTVTLYWLLAAYIGEFGWLSVAFALLVLAVFTFVLWPILTRLVCRYVALNGSPQ